MSVLVYIDSTTSHLPKHALEAVNYGSKIGDTIVITNGSTNKDSLAELGKYGAKKVLVNDTKTDDPTQLSKLIQAAAIQEGSDTIIMSYDLTGKAVAPRISAGLKAGYVPGAVALPDAENRIKTNVFS
jgi:electron transfer flavoprotein alpha subunit